MLVIGHRGASRDAPENTPEAFELADAMGADGVELDVRLAPDGRLVVFHDHLPDDPVVLASLPEFATVLDACGSRMLVNVEIKADAPDIAGATSLAVVEPTIDELMGRGRADRARWLISSFSPDVVGRCRTIAPEIATAQLTVGIDGDVIGRCVAAGHAAVHPIESALDAAVVADAHRARLVVTTWTCNDPDRITELASFDVDGVCTDVPDVARSALGRSGAADPSPRWPRRP